MIDVLSIIAESCKYLYSYSYVVYSALKSINVAVIAIKQLLIPSYRRHIEKHKIMTASTAMAAVYVRIQIYKEIKVEVSITIKMLDETLTYLMQS